MSTDLRAAMDRINPHDCNCAAKPPTIPLYRDPHDHLPDCPMGQWLAGQAGLSWAREVLKDPKRAAVEASGMSQDDLDELRREFGEEAG